MSEKGPFYKVIYGPSMLHIMLGPDNNIYLDQILIYEI